MRDRIAKLIRQRGLKQSVIARQAGLPDYWLSNRLTGRTAIQADDVPVIATAMGVDPCDFFHEESAQPRGDRMYRRHLLMEELGLTPGDISAFVKVADLLREPDDGES